MNWTERIAKARKTGEFTAEDKELACSIEHDSLAERLHTFYGYDLSSETYEQIYCKYTTYDKLTKRLSSQFHEQVIGDNIDAAERIHLRTQSLHKSTIERRSAIDKPESTDYLFQLVQKNDMEHSYKFIRQSSKLRLGTIMCSFGIVYFIINNKVTELTILETELIHNKMKEIQGEYTT